jgi:hypothetical protein
MEESLRVLTEIPNVECSVRQSQKSKDAGEDGQDDVAFTLEIIRIRSSPCHKAPQGRNSTF